MTHIKQKKGQAEPMRLEIKRRGNKFLCIYPQDKKNKLGRNQNKRPGKLY